MLRVIWTDESKTGLGFEIGPRQQKCQRKSSLQSMANPAVVNLLKLFSNTYGEPAGNRMNLVIDPKVPGVTMAEVDNEQQKHRIT